MSVARLAGLHYDETWFGFYAFTFVHLFRILHWFELRSQWHAVLGLFDPSWHIIWKDYLKVGSPFYYCCSGKV